MLAQVSSAKAGDGSNMSRYIILNTALSGFRRERQANSNFLLDKNISTTVAGLTFTKATNVQLSPTNTFHREKSSGPVQNEIV